MAKTIVSAINWKESFLSHPFIVLNAISPMRYRIVIKEFTDDGVMTILPSLEGTIDDLFLVLEGCFSKESNFSEILKEYYGALELKEIEFDFNGISGKITSDMTAFEAKVDWIRRGILLGYRCFTRNMTKEEVQALNADPEIKEKMERFYDEL